MNYHLSRQGQTLGTFSIEELQTRRRAGELSGREFVWRAGMAEWRPLDEVLAQVAAGTAPPPLPASAVPKRANLLWVWFVAGFSGLVVLGVIVWAGVQGYRAGRRTQTIFQQAGTGGEVALAGRPISWRTNTMTEKDVQRRARAFRMRQWVEGYKRDGQRDPAYDAEAVQFLETWIASNYGGEQPTNHATPEQLGETLGTNPACSDPLVLTAAAATSIEMNECIRRLERALSGYESSKYRAYPRWNATILLADRLSENAGRVKALDSSALELFKRLFTDDSVRPEEQAEIADVLLYGWGHNFFQRNGPEVVRLAKDTSKDFQWLAWVLEGEYEVDEAWRARGGGYSDTVSEKGWEGFSSHLANARSSLTRAWQLRPDLPESAGRMIYVAMGDSGLEQMREWFDRAVAAQIDEPNAWSNLRWGLRPRWHGNLEAMRALGVAAVNTLRFDTDVPRKFFDVVSDLEAELKTPAGQHIYSRADLWPHIQQLYEGYIAEPTQSERRDGWRASYSVVAYFAGHYDIARCQLEALNWSPPDWSLNGWAKDLSLMPLEVAARTGSVGSQIAQAEAYYRRGQLPEPLRQYRELASTTNLDTRTREFIRLRLATIEMEQRVHGSDWVDFLPAADLDPNWVMLRGEWKRLPDGALEVRAGPAGHLAYSRVRVGPDFEVRGEFELVQTSSKSFQAGLAMGLPNLFNYDWHAFRMKRNDTEGEVASFSEGWTRSQVYQKVALSPEHNSFVFRYQRGRGTATVNGREVFRQTPPPRGLHMSRRDFLLGLGAFNDTNETVIRYRNLQVRRLAPTTAEAEPEE